MQIFCIKNVTFVEKSKKTCCKCLEINDLRFLFFAKVLVSG